MSTSTSRLVVIDCETTGLGQHDRILEVAVLTLDSETWEPTDEYDTLINPERDVGPVGVHGITASMVEAAPTFPEIASALTRRLHGAILVAHNLPFDARMLRYEFDRLGVAFDVGSGLCTLKATGEKLISACRRFGIALNVQHRALADARATAALAREALDPGTDLKPAMFGYVPQLLNVRTLRRESLDAGISDLARVVSLTYYPCADEALLQYLDALDWALDDCHIDDRERAAIEDLASALGISDEQRHQAHYSYLSSIIAAAERDGVVTETEHQLISQIAEVLGIVDDVIVPQVTQLPAASSLRNGMRVCFTGNAIVEGASVSRSFLEETAALVGMQPVGSVTKRGCDLLVVADSSTQSGKARKALEFGIPMMTVVDFLNQAGKNVG